MIKFNEWVKLKENMWGNIPVKGRKPSDGPSGANGGMQGVAPQQQAPMGQKMMKKKMEKKMEK